MPWGQGTPLPGCKKSGEAPVKKEGRLRPGAGCLTHRECLYPNRVGALRTDGEVERSLGEEEVPSSTSLPPHPDPKPSDLHPEGLKSFPPNPQQPGPRASAHPGSPRQRARSDSAREPRPGAGYWRGQGRPRKDPGPAGRTEGVGRGGRILGDPVSCKILGGEGLRPSSFRSATPRREGGWQGGLARAQRRRQGALAGRTAAAHLGRGGSCEVARPGQVPVLPWVQSFTSRPLVGSEGVRLPSLPGPEGRSLGRWSPSPGKH